VHVDETKEHYRCCPQGRKPPATDGHPPKSSKVKSRPVESVVPADEMPAALGASWVDKPIDLSEHGWTVASCATGVIALLLIARKWLLVRPGAAKEL